VIGLGARLRSSWRARRARAVYSPRYLLDLPGTQHDPLRGERLLTWLAMQRLVRRRDVLQPRPATMKALRRIHDDGYLDRLSQPGGLVQALGFDVAPRMRRAILAMMRAQTGGTVEAARAALASGGVTLNLGGGFHHARHDRGGGFCVFNDVAVAIGELRAGGFGGRILVVDCDLHDGDGTRLLFADDASVHTLSLHNRAWDTAPAIEDTQVELGAGIADAAYLAALERILPPLLERFQPELVFYLAGADAAEHDPLGDGRLSAPGIVARDLYVARAVRPRRGSRRLPLVVLLAGGYGQQAWRHSAPFVSWLFGGRAATPPPTEEVTVQRYRRITRLLSPSELGGVAAGEDWGLTDEDLVGGMDGAPPETRLLGYYTEPGVELILERAGILDRLRTIGFSDPHVELDVSNPGGQTVRIWGSAGHRDLLAELRLRRERRAVPGMELLAVEWLLLQNPRAEFTAGRQPLPGQKHPGLGFSPDVGALLVLICERLGLDGVYFVPSHMHLAYRASRLLRFLHPVDEARWRALRPLVEGMPLAEAARAVAEGRVVDANGAPLDWVPAPMILPLSPRLKALVEGPDFEKEVEAASARFRFTLSPS
jgi:acetoin utilization deacetylase AcuC-like enzyme